MVDRPQTLSSTLRERRRYMAFQVVTKTEIPPSDIAGAIWHSILNLLGELGTAQAEVWLVKSVYDEKNRMGLVRCSHTAVEHVRTALALVSRIGDAPVTIKVIGISGTISAAKKKYFGETDLQSYEG
jgi:ribonuclease P/MRP protein subunit POP5